METSKDVIILKPHVINTLLPKFLKHVFWNSGFFVFLYMIYWLVDNFFNVGYNNYEVILFFVFLTIIISFFIILKDVIDVKATEFRFYAHYLEHRYKFFREDNHSINYSSITDIQVKKDIWDVICGVGDVIVHTANDDYDNGSRKSLVLKNVKNPDKIKSEISKRIHL